MTRVPPDTTTQLDGMLPVGCLLTVHASVFGACELGPIFRPHPDDLDALEPPQLVLDNTDGYPENDRVEGDGHTIVVYVEKRSFFSELGTLEYELERIVDEETNVSEPNNS